MLNHALNSSLAEQADIRMGHPFRGSIPEIPDGSVRVVQIRDVPRTGLSSYDTLVATEVASRKPPTGCWTRTSCSLPEAPTPLRP